MPPCRLHLVADARFAIGDVASTLGTLGIIDQNRAIRQPRVSSNIFSESPPKRRRPQPGPPRKRCAPSSNMATSPSASHRRQIDAARPARVGAAAVGHFPARRSAAAARAARSPSRWRSSSSPTARRRTARALAAASLARRRAVAPPPARQRRDDAQLLRVASRPSAHRNGLALACAARARVHRCRCASPPTTSTLRRSLPGCDRDAARRRAPVARAAPARARAAPTARARSGSCVALGGAARAVEILDG